VEILPECRAAIVFESRPVDQLHGELAAEFDAHTLTRRGHAPNACLVPTALVPQHDPRERRPVGHAGVPVAGGRHALVERG
jgi:hypothetical protein